MNARLSTGCSAKGPKLAALLAYDAGELSAEGRRRLERHLERCDVCAETRRSMKVYDAIASDIRKLDPVVDATSHVELSLRREAKKIAAETRARVFRPRAIAYGALAALAAAAVFVLGVAQFDPDGRSSASVDHATSIENARVEGEITAAGGETFARGIAGLVPMSVGDVVRESATLETRDGRLHARLAEGTGIVLGPATSVRVDRLREGETRLLLQRGRLSNEVAPLGDHGSYSVVAGSWRVEVKGTRFSVSKGANGFGLTLEEGKVDLFHDESLVAVLDAPARFGVVESAAVEEPLAIESVTAGSTPSSWPILRLPDVGATSWSIGDARVGASGALAMRVAPGELSVVAYHGELEMFRTVVPVRGDLALEPPPELGRAPAPRVGELPPELIAPVVQAGMRQLRRCQERTEVIGRFMLEVTIGVNGDVVRARLVGSGGSTPDPALIACVTEEALGWHFAPPSGAGVVRFRQPIAFGTMPTNRVDDPNRLD
jgi:ferric-dicitrate binding protein FerR (iron transport regulator)